MILQKTFNRRWVWVFVLLILVGSFGYWMYWIRSNYWATIQHDKLLVRGVFNGTFQSVKMVSKQGNWYVCPIADSPCDILLTPLEARLGDDESIFFQTDGTGNWRGKEIRLIAGEWSYDMENVDENDRWMPFDELKYLNNDEDR